MGDSYYTGPMGLSRVGDEELDQTSRVGGILPELIGQNGLPRLG